MILARLLINFYCEVCPGKKLHIHFIFSQHKGILVIFNSLTLPMDGPSFFFWWWMRQCKLSFVIFRNLIKVTNVICVGLRLNLRLSFIKLEVGLFGIAKGFSMKLGLLVFFFQQKVSLVNRTNSDTSSKTLWVCDAHWITVQVFILSSVRWLMYNIGNLFLCCSMHISIRKDSVNLNIHKCYIVFIFHYEKAQYIL